jgi:hypothetical protein
LLFFTLDLDPGEGLERLDNLVCLSPVLLCISGGESTSISSEDTDGDKTVEKKDPAGEDAPGLVAPCAPDGTGGGGVCAIRDALGCRLRASCGPFECDGAEIRGRGRGVTGQNWVTGMS